MSDERQRPPLRGDEPPEAEESKQLRRQPYRPPTLEPLGSVWESTAGISGSGSDAFVMTSV